MDKEVETDNFGVSLLLVEVVVDFGNGFNGGEAFAEECGDEGCELSSFKLVLDVFKDDLKGAPVTGEDTEGDEMEAEVGDCTDASPSVRADVVVDCVA